MRGLVLRDTRVVTIEVGEKTIAYDSLPYIDPTIASEKAVDTNPIGWKPLN